MRKIFLCTIGIIAFTAALSGTAQPSSSSSEENTITIDEFVEYESAMETEDLQLCKQKEPDEVIIPLLNRINSLELLTEYLLSQGCGVSAHSGSHVTQRCPKGFRSVPGDKNCYYLSNYKARWVLARETCLAFGPDVDLLSIDSSKKQRVVMHLIQSDPELKKVKKWWTSGRGIYGMKIWVWFLRVRMESLTFNNFADQNILNQPTAEICITLDADKWYRWRKTPCLGRPNRFEDYPELPEHHFICQAPAVEYEPPEDEESTDAASARRQQANDILQQFGSGTTLANLQDHNTSASQSNSAEANNETATNITTPNLITKTATLPTTTVMNTISTTTTPPEKTEEVSSKTREGKSLDTTTPYIVQLNHAINQMRKAGGWTELEKLHDRVNSGAPPDSPEAN